jgi:hypothetical protein
MKNEPLLIAVKDGVAENVGRQQIAGKLDALKGEGEGACQCLGKRGLAYARYVFDQQVAAREQTRDSELHRLVLSYNYLANLLYKRVNIARHARIICGNNALRNHRFLFGVRGSAVEFKMAWRRREYDQ